MGRKSLSTPTLAAPGLVYPLPSGPPPATTRLPRLRLETEDERAALRALKLLPGNRFQKRFEGLILAHLALIRDACNLVAPKQRKPLWWPVIASPDGRVSNGTSLAKLLCQAAASISVTADRLEKKLENRGPSLSLTPVLTIRLCADELASRADELARAAYPASKRIPRHRSRPETTYILHLARYVKRETGQTHWSELAILLRRACKDMSVTGERIRKLVTYYGDHNPGSLRRAFKKVPKARAAGSAL